MTAITLASLTKSYLGATVLDGVSAQVRPGELAVLTGPSGSGKTTLLNLVSALDTPDAGTITVGDTDVTSLRGDARTAFRARHGHVFQRSGLLGGLTVRENIEAGHLLTGHAVDAAWVAHLTGLLGIRSLLDARATTVSGGQAQRVALIRALAHRPPVVFADEPTASLDTSSKHQIHAVLREVARDEGTTILMVSHDAISADYATTTLHLRDGAIVGP